MEIRRSLVLDSALAVTLGTALSFFLGLAHEQGTAAGLGIPAEFVARDVWRTVAAGADGLLAAVVFFPFSFFGVNGFHWNVANVVVIGVALLGALLWFFRRSGFKPVALLLWGLVFAFFQIHVTAANRIQDWVRRSEQCLRGQGCPAARVPNRVVYSSSDGVKKETIGMLLSMNAKFMIMFSDGGLLVVPNDSVQEIATAKPLPSQ